MTDTSMMKIDDHIYPLEKVILQACDRTEADIDLVMILHTNINSDLESGFSFHNEPVSAGFHLELFKEGVFSADRISGLELDIQAKNPHNEDPLGGCIILEPGRSLKLQSLHVEFGQVECSHIPIHLTALCVHRGIKIPERNISVTADFFAEIQIRRPYANVADDLKRYYVDHGIS
jgi:hypothetical protein